PVGVGGAGPREQAAAGAGRRESHPGDGPVRGPPGRTGVGPRLCAAVSHRWLSGVSDGVADALWAVGAATTSAGARPGTPAALEAAAAAPLRAGAQDRAPTAAGPRKPPRGVRGPGGRRAGAVGLWLADPDSLRGAAQ